MAKRYSQPQGSAQIDWANPITNGLVVAINPAESVSNGIPKGSSGTIVYAATNKGFGARFSDAAAAYLSYASDGLKPASGAPYTLLCLYRLNSIPSSSARIVSSFASNTYGYTIAPNNVNFRAIIAGGGVNTVFTGSAVSVKDKTDVLSFDGTSGRYYEGGRLAAGPTAATSNLSVRDFFLGSDSVGSNSAPVTITLTAFWNRALSDAEIKSLSDNPWQIFQPTNRAIYPGTAAAGSTYTLTADAASYSITGADASLIVNRKLIADTANIPIAGADATLTYTPIGGPTYTLTADAGSIAVNGNAATLAFNRVLTADAGSYSVAGQAVGLAFNRVLSAATANIPVAGQDATLTYTNNGFTYTLSAEAGAIGVTGQDARLVWSGEQTTYSGGYEHLGRRQTPKQRKEQRQRLGIIAQDIKEATKKVARAVIADTGRTDPVSHFEDHKAQFLRMLVDELKGYQPPDMADVISRQIRIAYAIQEQEEEELLLLLH